MAGVPKARSMAALRLMSDLKAMNSEPPAVREMARPGLVCMRGELTLHGCVLSTGVQRLAGVRREHV